jgi:adenosylcobinamide-phosphate synthase
MGEWGAGVIFYRQDPAMLALALVAALVWDSVWGEMANVWHPVVYMGRTIRLGRDLGLRTVRGPFGQLLWGAAMAMVIPGLFTILAMGLLAASHRLGAVWEGLLSVYLLKSSFAIRALRDAAFDVKKALATEDLERSRFALRSLCSRDASTLEAKDIASATIGSLAENLSDSVVAPLFFFLVFGIPGAICYRVVNTMDAIVGYRGKYEYLGKVPARLDDLLNLIPARITACLLLLASIWDLEVCRRAAHILRRDRRKTPSPNGGWPMSTMAGLLRVEVNKIGVYSLGDPVRPLSSGSIDEAWQFARAATCLLGAAAITLLVVQALWI